MNPDPIERRNLLRGGAILAGVAGVAVASAVAAPTAHADDGDPLQLGAENIASSRTALRLADDGSPEPSLALANASGPVLDLGALDESWDEPLGIGQVANRTTGPLLGVDHGAGVVNTYVALGVDLQSLPIPYAFPPYRLLDTRTAEGRDAVVATSSGAYDAAHRLRGGHWLDLAVLPADDETSAQGVYANVTVTAATAGGYLTVYPPGERPVTSSLNYTRNQTIANGGFFPVEVSEEHLAVRIYVSGTTHVIVDVTGFTLLQQPGPLAAARTRRGSAARRKAVDPPAIRRRLGRRL